MSAALNPLCTAEIFTPVDLAIPAIRVSPAGEQAIASIGVNWQHGQHLLISAPKMQRTQNVSSLNDAFAAIAVAARFTSDGDEIIATLGQGIRSPLQMVGKRTASTVDFSEVRVGTPPAP